MYSVLAGGVVISMAESSALAPQAAKGIRQDRTIAMAKSADTTLLRNMIFLH